MVRVAVSTALVAAAVLMVLHAGCSSAFVSDGVPSSDRHHASFDVTVDPSTGQAAIRQTQEPPQSQNFPVEPDIDPEGRLSGEITCTFVQQAWNAGGTEVWAHFTFTNWATVYDDDLAADMGARLEDLVVSASVPSESSGKYWRSRNETPQTPASDDPIPAFPMSEDMVEVPYIEALDSGGTTQDLAWDWYAMPANTGGAMQLRFRIDLEYDVAYP